MFNGIQGRYTTQFSIHLIRFSITSICLNGSNYEAMSNYAQWAQAVEVFLLGRKEFNYLIDDHPPTADPKYADWRVEDAQIRS